MMLYRPAIAIREVKFVVPNHLSACRVVHLPVLLHIHKLDCTNQYDGCIEDVLISKIVCHLFALFMLTLEHVSLLLPIAYNL